MRFQLVVVILAAVINVTHCQLDAQCVDHLRTLDGRAFRVDFEKPLSYNDAYYECRNRGGVLPAWPDLVGVQVNCGSELLYVDSGDECLPIKSREPVRRKPSDMDSVGDLLQYQNPGVPAYDVTSGKCSFVDVDQVSSRCLVCLYNDIRLPVEVFDRHFLTAYDDMSPRSNFVVRFTSVDVRQTTEIDEEEFKAELKTLLKPSVADTIELQHAVLDETRHLQVEYHLDSPILAAVAQGNATTLVLNNTFTITVEDVSFCPSEELVDKDGVVTVWPKTSIGHFVFNVSREPLAIQQRYCHFDEVSYHGRWDARVSNWELALEPCLSPDDLYYKEELYKQFLDTADINTRHSNVLHGFASSSSPVDSNTIDEVTRLLGREIDLKNELNDEQIFQDLVTITAKLKMDSDRQVVAIDIRAFLIVADIDANEPVVGFAFRGDVIQGYTNDSITVEKAPAPLERNATTPFAVDVSPKLMAANSRVVFLALWKHMPKQQVYGGRTYQYLEVSVMFPLGHVLEGFSNYFVDISFFHERFHGYSQTVDDTALICVAWDSDLRVWDSLGCGMLYVDLNGGSACRCSGKYFVLHDGVPIGRFALEKRYVAHKLASYNNHYTAGASSSRKHRVPTFLVEILYISSSFILIKSLA